MNKEDRKKILDDIARVGHKVVGTAGIILDVAAAGLQRQRHGRKPPAQVTRRQIAYMLRTSQFCANRACRRSHCCRGEPAHCLQAALPLLPYEALGTVLARSRPARASRRKAW